jgi:hypothetical protein
MKLEGVAPPRINGEGSSYFLQPLKLSMKACLLAAVGRLSLAWICTSRMTGYTLVLVDEHLF